MVAHDVELRRVPDLQHEQHGREQERAEHRPRAAASTCARRSPRPPAPRRRRSRSRGRPRDRRRCRAPASSERADLRPDAAQDVGEVAGQLLDGLGAGVEPRAPLGQPDADDDALAELGERERRALGRRRLAGLLGLRDGLLVDDGERDLDAVAGSDSSSSVKPGSRSTPVSRPVSPSSATGWSGRSAPVRRSECSRAPNGSVSVGASGRSRRSRATSTPRRSESAPNEAIAAALGRRSARRRRASSVGTQRSGPASTTPSRSPVSPRARGGERQVGGDVVADVLLVEEGEQRRDVVEAGGQAAREQPRVVGRAAALERVRDAVAVVVERVGPEPGDGREDDEDRRRLLAADGERDGGDVLARAHAQDVHAGVAAGRADLDLAAALALALEPRRARRSLRDSPASGSPPPARAMRQLNGRPRESTANATFSPAFTGSAGGRTSSERTLTPGSPRTAPAPSGAERPTLPAWSRTSATTW